MPKPRLCFTVVGEVLRGQQFLFEGDQPISIGRTPENTMALDHKSVSRQHARIELENGNAVLVDLGSHNGTRVGDKLVSRHVLQPGDVVGLGEILLAFSLVDEGAPGPAALPMVVAVQGSGTAALARPLSFDEIYSQGVPPETVAVPTTRKVPWALLYTIALAAVIGLGLLAFWAVGRKPSGPPVYGVQLKVGDVLPVDLAWVPDPNGRFTVRGITRVEDVRAPEDPRVADAKKTKFRTFVALRGKALGTTDIEVIGPPAGVVVLRVLVRGTNPEPELEVWRRKSVSERRDYGHQLIERARVLRKKEVDQYSWKVIHDLDLASKLLEAIPGEGQFAVEAARGARELRDALSQRFDELANRIDVLVTQGRFPDAIKAAGELVNLFQDPETEEHYVVNAYNESLAQAAARAEREAQEKR